MIVEIRAGICPTCKDIIYSRAQHDLMKCTCGECSIDGGSYILGEEDAFSYIRVQGDQVTTTVKFTEFTSIKDAKVKLYDDWASRVNKYGRISK